MALRIPTKTSDHITLISYVDDALDFNHPDWDKALKVYLSSDVPDYQKLPMKEGVEPTKFTLRPLSERELAIAADMARAQDDDKFQDLDVTSFRQNATETNYQILRFGLVAVQGLEGWQGKKERVYSSTAFTMDSVEEIDRFTAEFLALSIFRWSALQKKTSLHSGSSQEGSNGTSLTNADLDLSTVRSAESAKVTQPCMDATKKEQTAQGK